MEAALKALAEPHRRRILTLARNDELSADACPAAVWALLDDPEKIVGWKGLAATLAPRPGGEYRCEVLPGHTSAGEVVEIDPPRRLVHTWGWEGGDLAPGATTVEYE